MLCNSILCRLSKIPLSSFFFLIMCCAGIKKNYADPISLHIQKGKNPKIRKRQCSTMLLNSSVGNLSYTYIFFSVLFCFFFLLFLLGGWECREKYRVTKRMETVSSIIPGILYMSEIPKNRHLLCKAFRNVKRALGGKNEQKSRLLIKKKNSLFFFFFLFLPVYQPQK